MAAIVTVRRFFLRRLKRKKCSYSSVNNHQILQALCRIRQNAIMSRRVLLGGISLFDIYSAFILWASVLWAFVWIPRRTHRTIRIICWQNVQTAHFLPVTHTFLLLFFVLTTDEFLLENFNDAEAGFLQAGCSFWHPA